MKQSIRQSKDVLQEANFTSIEHDWKESRVGGCKRKQQDFDRVPEGLGTSLGLKTTKINFGNQSKLSVLKGALEKLDSCLKKQKTEVNCTNNAQSTSQPDNSKMENQQNVHKGNKVQKIISQNQQQQDSECQQSSKLGSSESNQKQENRVELHKGASEAGNIDQQVVEQQQIVASKDQNKVQYSKDFEFTKLSVEQENSQPVWQDQAQQYELKESDLLEETPVALKRAPRLGFRSLQSLYAMDVINNTTYKQELQDEGNQVGIPYQLQRPKDKKYENVEIFETWRSFVSRSSKKVMGELCGRNQSCRIEQKVMARNI
eukprot:TRINITY_DN4789_c0_g3_i2.p2 TRINITY_DN4789_c0_g3~~TRINITY_DN4789_c0_g3_i2.p2  ORF type:complete len:317 (-),score=35.06 TRINITY_DN4789_c0_g3_i2:872-1822(-)